MLTDPSASRMFDLSQERPDLVDRYGRTRFGQSCLLARRLVEHGVPFVQVNWSDHVEAEEDSGDGGWDHHYRNFQIMQDRHAPWLDQAYATLLTDLRQRGLLERTLVLAIGELAASHVSTTKPAAITGTLLQRPGRRRRHPRRPRHRESDRRAERPTIAPSPPLTSPPPSTTPSASPANNWRRSGSIRGDG